MATAKTDIYSKEERAIAELAKAIAHPARIAILKILFQKDDCICKDIVDELPIAQSTVSQHLKELKKVGLIEGEIKSPKVCYRLNKQKWEEAGMLWTTLFKHCC